MIAFQDWEMTQHKAKHNYIFAVTRKSSSGRSGSSRSDGPPTTRQSAPPSSNLRKGFINEAVLSREELRQNYFWPDRNRVGDEKGRVFRELVDQWADELMRWRAGAWSGASRPVVDTKFSAKLNHVLSRWSPSIIMVRLVFLLCLVGVLGRCLRAFCMTV